jgi:hypothetical protein
MPRNIRPFWLSFSIKGRDSELSGGPRSGDGGFTGTITMRQDGEVGPAVRLHGSVRGDTIRLIIDVPEGATAVFSNGRLTISTRR